MTGLRCVYTDVVQCFVYWFHWAPLKRHRETWVLSDKLVFFLPYRVFSQTAAIFRHTMYM